MPGLPQCLQLFDILQIGLDEYDFLLRKVQIQTQGKRTQWQKP
ncbi:unnamed protein product, partial [marine sediment metagenome]